MLRSRVTRFGSVLDENIGNAKTRWSDREGLVFVVELHQDKRSKGGQQADMLRGFGEASPLPGYSPDTIEECEQCLESITLPDEKHLSMQSIDTLVSSMPELPAARFAVETALADLLAQLLQQGVAGLFGHYATSARRCALLDTNAPITSAAAILKRGLRCAKLKVGGEWAEELTVIKQLRSEFPSLALRLDVNAAWTPPEAKRRLALLQGLGIEFVEQPVAPGVMHSLAGSKVPLAADESLHSQAGRDALEPLLGDAALRVLVLKPTVLGGISACLKLQQWAHRHRASAIASHCFEGPVGTAAVAELALTMDSSLAAGVDKHPVLANLGDVSVPQFGERYLLINHIGLGVELEI
ncbi:MAG: O-succinylbenzoate synthase [Myxococcales bacterium]|nr:O-succinylbenzoate synthase [Myxococcales bacterium]